ncbi:hypothetical protein SKAU_G00128160 [Synaphobranchus kaupii]|uniref:Uncharacterized protein n=1 Tax=Synaphobranchus kaupii TaxID=118154 RepID=A0A9Q1FPV4_SYNKA|nr:hypothetical protein SKAU_G00128160 [Synaphobranchus kaupii]
MPAKKGDSKSAKKGGKGEAEKSKGKEDPKKGEKKPDAKEDKKARKDDKKTGKKEKEEPPKGKGKDDGRKGKDKGKGKKAVASDSEEGSDAELLKNEDDSERSQEEDEESDSEGDGRRRGKGKATAKGKSKSKSRYAQSEDEDEDEEDEEKTEDEEDDEEEEESDEDDRRGKKKHKDKHHKGKIAGATNWLTKRFLSLKGRQSSERAGNDRWASRTGSKRFPHSSREEHYSGMGGFHNHGYEDDDDEYGYEEDDYSRGSSPTEILFSTKASFTISKQTFIGDHGISTALQTTLSSALSKKEKIQPSAISTAFKKGAIPSALIKTTVSISSPSEQRF